MARMDFAATPQVAGGPTHWELLDPAQITKDDGENGHWSIDEEPMGETLRDSSWMLRKGLQVIEDLAPDLWPMAWTGSRWNDCLRDGNFPALFLADLD